MRFFILLGAPGSGKGTQAHIIEKKYNFTKISTGEILRHEIESGSDLGMKIKTIVESGDFIDDDLIVDIIKNQIMSKINSTKGFILDGFPRNINQAIELDGMLKTLSFDITKAIYLEIPDDKLVNRIIGRYVCSDCGESYNKIYKNTKIENVCDVCGCKEFIHRADDNEETIRNRLDVYAQQTAPLLPYYESSNKLVRINGDRMIDEVTISIDESIGNDTSST